MQQLKTIKIFCDENPSFSSSAMRGLIHKANPHSTHKGIAPGNGLIESGAIVRLGSRIYIDDIKFFAWIASKQTAPASSPLLNTNDSLIQLKQGALGK